MTIALTASPDMYSNEHRILVTVVKAFRRAERSSAVFQPQSQGIGNPKATFQGRVAPLFFILAIDVG